MATKEQLSQWDQILVGMESNGFTVSDTEETATTPYNHSYYLKSTVVYQGISFPLRSSNLIGVYYLIHAVTLTRALGEGQDYTFLSPIKRPEAITLLYDADTGDVDSIDNIRRSINKSLGQKVVLVEEVDPYASKLEDYTYAAIVDGSVRFSQVFQKPKPRRVCSMELDIRPSTKKAFALGLLPYHVRQEGHYCIDTPTMPLIPVPLNERITNFTASFQGLQNLPEERFNQLFQGMSLPGRFAIYYNHQPDVPYVQVSARRRWGGNFLKLEVGIGIEYPETSKVAEELASHMDIFNQYYSNFKPYQRDYPVVV